MARLIDADCLMQILDAAEVDETGYWTPQRIRKVLKYVDAIPKADYENRLKADMVAMLEELQLEIEEQKRDELSYQQTWNHPLNVCISITQQKINNLKED